MIDIRPIRKFSGRPKGGQPQWHRFEMQAKEVERRVSNAIKRASETPYLRPTQVLKRAVYGVVTDILAGERLDRLKAELRRQTDVILAENDNPFVWGFRLVEVASRIGVKPADRSKYAAELLYAHQHGIPESLVTCFLDQAGAYPLIKRRLEKGHREKWALKIVREYRS